MPIEDADWDGTTPVNWIAQRTVFIVDDDPAARDSVRALVESKGLRAKTFFSAEDFLNSYDPAERGCAVVDVRMLGMSGVDLQQRLKERNASLPVILITGFGDVPTAVRAMQAGAVTFLEKPCQDQELWHYIEQALDQESVNRESAERLAECQALMAKLSADEMEVLRKVVEGLPNKRIASTLDIGLRTVELRRANIMKKFNANSLAEMVRVAITAGLE